MGLTIAIIAIAIIVLALGGSTTYGFLRDQDENDRK